MENTENKEMLITDKQLEDTISKAVDKAKEEVKAEIAKSANPFGGNFISKIEKEVNPAFVGAYANAAIHANMFGKTLAQSAEILMNKNKTYASEVIFKGVNETTADEGGYFIVPEVYNQFIELVTAQSVIRSLPGVQQATMSSASLLINRETTGAGAYWAGEAPTPTKSAPRYGQYNITPKDLYSWATISKSLIADTAFNVEQTVQTQLIKAIALAEDAAFLTGSGSAYQPKGIFEWMNAANKVSPSGTSTEQYETDFFAAELAVRGQNFMEDLYWVMNWSTYSTLRTKLRVTTGIVAWPELRESEPMLLGYPVKFSNTTSNALNKIFLINPSDFLIVDRAGLNLMVNPIQNDANFPVSINEILVVAQSRVDCVLLHDKSSACVNVV